MDATSLKFGGLNPGDGMGDFMRFTTDAPWPLAGEADSTAGDFTRWPANEPAIRRLSGSGC